MTKGRQSRNRDDLHAKRRAMLMHALDATFNIGAVIITHAVDIRYLTGATEGVTAILLVKGSTTVFTSKMFEHQIPKQARNCNVVINRQAFEESNKILRSLRYRRALGYQGNKLPHAHYCRLLGVMDKRALVDIGDAVTKVRAIKDANERREIKRCVTIAEKAFLELRAKGASYLLTRTERQLAAELEYGMCMLGADRQAFPDNGIIVAAGANSASCHHFPGTRKPRKGEPLLVDWGAEKNGYRSDITRVLFPGAPKKLFCDLFDIVSKANAAGKAAVHDGASCAVVSNAGWDVVRAAGYGDQIRHGLGHGVGLEIHEPPGIGAGGSQKPSSDVPTLKEGMVVTIEPGIYLSGKGGIRIEDDVCVTKTGCRSLTTLPTDLEFAVLR
jgi:Xaa-Pro aminopeptidase